MAWSSSNLRESYRTRARPVDERVPRGLRGVSVGERHAAWRSRERLTRQIDHERLEEVRLRALARWQRRQRDLERDRAGRAHDRVGSDRRLRRVRKTTHT